MMRVRVSTGYTQSDCDSCGEKCGAKPENAAAHQAWARRHVRKNPDHTVFVATEKTRIYDDQEI